MRVFRTAAGELPLGQKVYLMGILNVTPDSFSDGGKFNTAAAALRHSEEMAKQGADLIDVGAVSTRPFAAPVSEAEEWERLSGLLPGPLVRAAEDVHNVRVELVQVRAGAGDEARGRAVRLAFGRLACRGVRRR